MSNHRMKEDIYVEIAFEVILSVVYTNSLSFFVINNDFILGFVDCKGGNIDILLRSSSYSIEFINKFPTVIKGDNRLFSI